MYKVGLNDSNTRYTVESEEGSVIADYKYKQKAYDHVEALNSNEEYIEKPNSYYKNQY
jgi:hypothetical protein